MPKNISEYFLLILLGVFFLFTASNFQKDLGYLFLGMVLLTGLLYMFDKSPKTRLETKPNRMKSLVLALGAYVALIVLSSILIPILQNLGVLSGGTSITGINSVMQVLAQVQSSLAFEGSKVLNLIAFGFFVAVTETWLWGTLWEALTDNLQKIRIGFNFSTLAVFAVLASLFTLFHSTAKGIDNDVGLFTVFLFMTLTLTLIIYEKQYMAAVLFHIVSNSIALVISYGWVTGLIASVGVATVALIAINLALKNVRITRGYA